MNSVSDHVIVSMLSVNASWILYFFIYNFGSLGPVDILQYCIPKLSGLGYYKFKNFVAHLKVSHFLAA